MRGWISTALVLLGLDLIWLGVLARPLYDRALGDLLRPEALRLPALLFYFFYVSVTWLHAVRPANSVKDAMSRGAGLGCVAYGVYELTNWAVLKGWPGYIVPIDWLWGVVLTGAAAGAGYLASRDSR